MKNNVWRRSSVVENAYLPVPSTVKNRLNKLCKLIYNYLHNFLCHFTFIYNFICEIYGIKQSFKGILFYLFVFCFFFLRLGLTSSFGCLETHHVGQTGLKLSDPLVSAFVSAGINGLCYHTKKFSFIYDSWDAIYEIVNEI